MHFSDRMEGNLDLHGSLQISLSEVSQLQQLEFGCADRLHQLQQVAQRNGARTWMLFSFWFAVLSLFSVLFRVWLNKRKSS